MLEKFLNWSHIDNILHKFDSKWRLSFTRWFLITIFGDCSGHVVKKLLWRMILQGPSLGGALYMNSLICSSQQPYVRTGSTVTLILQMRKLGYRRGGARSDNWW